jgi:hypothetical protein
MLDRERFFLWDMVTALCLWRGVSDVGEMIRPPWGVGGAVWVDGVVAGSLFCSSYYIGMGAPFLDRDFLP